MKQKLTPIRKQLLAKVAKISSHLIDWAKKTTFFGLVGVPFYDILIFIKNELQRESLMLRANSLAFSFMLSLFPSIIFLFTLLPFIPIRNLTGLMFNFIENLQGVLPQNAYDIVYNTIYEVVHIPHSSLLSVGFLSAIFFSSNGMMSMMRAFDKAYFHDNFKRRSALKMRGIAIALTGVLGLLLISSVLLIVAGNSLIHIVLGWMDINENDYMIAYILKWAVMIALYYSTIAIIYRYGTAMKNRFPFISMGASLVVVLSLLTSLGFSYFVENFGDYNRIYGSIGTLVVIMIWLQMNALILLIGFELNVSIAVNRDLKEVIAED